ncbi:helix-turn-helix domain-containing protein [Lacrimispora xylanisolvens]|uniref:helix-turn-helix domain-containing protein n=1 Tax=Lacrimispora xylanisolvens TaxID=384636 RepID=UPI002402C19E
MSITGQRIKERRKQLEMSADDIADELGVSRSTIFRYENGQIEKVPANVLEKLAVILRTTCLFNGLAG